MTQPKMCEGCGLKPQSYHGRRWCYDCKPGSKGRPFPCRRCGSVGDYWAERLCRRCHQYAPQLPDSCRDCVAWGARRAQKWLCEACVSWRRLHPHTGPCSSCGQTLSLNDHHACRLCWQQTRYQAERGEPRDVALANRHGQQLAFANMASSQSGYRPRPRRDFRQPKHRTPAPEQARSDPRPSPDPDQLDLFAFHPIEDPARRYGFGEPPSPRLAARLDQDACEHAQRHGWSERQTTRARIGLRVLQGMHTLQATPINATDVITLVGLGLPGRGVLAILEANGVLRQDRPPRIHAWFADQIRDLPEPMTSELLTWFNVLYRGSTTPPRSRPRSNPTILTRTRWAMATLRIWADAGHQSLREITREDVLAVLPAQGTARATLGAALRSIFTTLKRHHVLFINPIARMRIGNIERRIPLPLDTARLRAAFNSPDPVTAALTALIGIHGLRPREACDLQLIDVRDSRLHLPDRTIVVATAAKVRLDTYLDHRQRRWPGTINPHFFVHTRSATTTGPVQTPWLTVKLGMSAQALRQDRIVDEVQATGDLRRICDFFGVTMATAEYYATTLNHPDLNGFTTEPAISSGTHGHH